MSDRLKIGQEVLIHGYVDEIRKDTIIIQNEGGYFGTVECEVTDNETPSTNEVLDKIRAEIEELRYGQPFRKFVVDECLKVIDKYKPESDIEKCKPCINCEDGCEEWAGCPCVHYKAESEG